MTPGPLFRAVAKRLAGAVAVLLGAATVAFTALQLIPGDPVTVMLGPGTAATPEIKAQIRENYGLDQPVALQYLHYLGNLLQGDLGESYQLQRPVAGLIGDQLWPTVQLALAALALAVVLAVTAAVATAGRRPALRAVATLLELLTVSSPPYWIGILLLTAFSFQLRIFPVAGDQDLSALVLPAVTLALPLTGVLAQVLREGLEAALGQPFAVTARSRGLSVTAVRLKHALRHAAVPLVTLVGWLTGSLLGGAVLVETVFARPGIGALTLQGTTNKDMPLVIGVVLLSAFVFVLLSTLVDLLYTVIDPRLRTG
ncbi:ABC transporter permease [Kitasatospora herbaricolor]|uniref:ABC transporter permease n=1 Tax=Kitasatospora herbaricolor TaxID=68217 RepID=UPI001747EEEF|nr:ABC transporter permease [Kitasatospora herbaricolor]MDQ0311482.1 peptide/nickel transport system permease protein [Kitasatospora herbaricolor]GGU94669.1 ABC transporter permease [Kitasatospora herbaricolor]